MLGINEPPAANRVICWIDHQCAHWRASARHIRRDRQSRIFPNRGERGRGLPRDAAGLLEHTQTITSEFEHRQ